LAQTPLLAATDAPSADQAMPAAQGGWSERLAHNWDFVQGRPGPLRQALAQVREYLHIAHDERFLANRGWRQDEYLQRAHVALHTIQRMFHNVWMDPMFKERLGYLSHTVQDMASGAVRQTPALYRRLDRELAHMLHWRWAP
jgi:hypothetical protein